MKPEADRAESRPLPPKTFFRAYGERKVRAACARTTISTTAEMAARLAKKRKVATEPEGPVITDSRFAKFQSDPRFRLPSKKHHVKLDKRFGGILKDEDFSRRAKVDRYGRPVDADGERKRLKRRYDFEEDEGGDLAADDDTEVQKELLRIEKHDPLRDGRDSPSSSEESSSDDETEVEEEIITLPEASGDEIPKGEVTSRVAVVNLDWDNIRAEDLMAVFSSFLPAAGRLIKVSVYPSDFGKERMEREEMEGPPKDIFKDTSNDYSDSETGSEDEDEEERIKKHIIKPDSGEDFDSAKLRQYQLDRLRYYFAILEFSSASAAKAVYDAADGAEYLSTANFFDLRFVPDGTEFVNDVARDECTRVPEGYKPNEFTTAALQHSKVKLTWDAEDVTRKEVQARAFRGSRKDIDENDLKAYLGTDSSEGEESEEDQATAKKEQDRLKMRALLGLGDQPTRKPGKQDADKPVGDIQITFSSGLSGSKEKKASVFENSYEDANETTLEKYVRRERERKQQRKAKMKGVVAPEAEAEVAEDAGFEDPFFAEPSNDKISASKLRKEERLKKRAEREAEEKAAAAKRAELELLMVDDKETEMRHFDMNEIEKAEKKARKKGKRHGKDKGSGGDQPMIDDFDVDTQDPRFARLYESHEFAIDPTNPKYKGTKGMKKLLDEGRNRRKNMSADDSAENNAKRNERLLEAIGDETDIKKLVEKVRKRK